MTPASGEEKGEEEEEEEDLHKLGLPQTHVLSHLLPQLQAADIHRCSCYGAQRCRGWGRAPNQLGGCIDFGG